jgi:hypothetical protein
MSIAVEKNNHLRFSINVMVNEGTVKIISRNFRICFPAVKQWNNICPLGAVPTAFETLKISLRGRRSLFGVTYKISTYCSCGFYLDCRHTGIYYTLDLYHPSSFDVKDKVRSLSKHSCCVGSPARVELVLKCHVIIRLGLIISPGIITPPTSAIAYTFHLFRLLCFGVLCILLFTFTTAQPPG